MTSWIPPSAGSAVICVILYASLIAVCSAAALFTSDSKRRAAAIRVLRILWLRSGK